MKTKDELEEGEEDVMAGKDDLVATVTLVEAEEEADAQKASVTAQRMANVLEEDDVTENPRLGLADLDVQEDASC